EEQENRRRTQEPPVPPFVNHTCKQPEQNRSLRFRGGEALPALRSKDCSKCGDHGWEARLVPIGRFHSPSLSRGINDSSSVTQSLPELVPFGGRALHTDALGRVPTSYLPTGGLVDSLDAGVDDPTLRRAVRRGDHFPFPPLVGETVANAEFH